jgi:hypothetical protein
MRPMISDDAILESAFHLDHCNSMAELLAVVAAFNGQLGPDGATGGLDKLTKWMASLMDKLRELGAAVGAESFTVTTGLHVSVSVVFGHGLGV